MLPRPSQAPRPSPRPSRPSPRPSRPSPRPSQAPRPSLAPSVVPPGSNTVTKRTRKPSAALRESVSALKKQKRAHDPETAAMLANCSIPCEDQEQEPPKKAPKKASKKVEINKSFFSALPKVVTVRRGTSVFFQC